MTQSLQTALDAWRQHLGNQAVLVGADIPQRLRADTSSASRGIAAVLQITCAQQLRKVMEIASANCCKVHPISTAKNWGYGTALPVEDDVTLIDLGQLKNFEVDLEHGIVTVEPGVTQGMLADELAKTPKGRSYMVPTTGAGRHVGLLSNALERGYGITPYTDHFASVTDIEAVLADGREYRSALNEAGSPTLARLFKWNIGPHVNGLFTQSGFGIVTRVTILLARRPAVVKACVFNLQDDALLEPAVERIRELLQTLPGIVGGLNLMNSHRVLAMNAPYPEPAALDKHTRLMTRETVAALEREYEITPWTGLATLYGPENVVKAAQGEIKRILKGIAKPISLTARQATSIARVLRLVPIPKLQGLSRKLTALAAAMPLFEGYPTDKVAVPLTYWRSRVRRPEGDLDPSRDGCGLLWYAPLVPMSGTEVRKFIDFARDTLIAHGLEPTITLTSQGDRLFDCTIPLLFDLNDPTSAANAHKCLACLIEQGQTLGFYPYRLHVDAMQAHQARHTNSSDLIHQLKKAWDPHDLIAPGRYR